MKVSVVVQFNAEVLPAQILFLMAQMLFLMPLAEV